MNDLRIKNMGHLGVAVPYIACFKQANKDLRSEQRQFSSAVLCATLAVFGAVIFGVSGIILIIAVMDGELDRAVAESDYTFLILFTIMTIAGASIIAWSLMSFVRSLKYMRAMVICDDEQLVRIEHCSRSDCDYRACSFAEFDLFIHPAVLMIHGKRQKYYLLVGWVGDLYYILGCDPDSDKLVESIDSDLRLLQRWLLKTGNEIHGLALKRGLRL